MPPKDRLALNINWYIYKPAATFHVLIFIFTVTEAIKPNSCIIVKLLISVLMGSFTVHFSNQMVRGGIQFSKEIIFSS